MSRARTVNTFFQGVGAEGETRCELALKKWVEFREQIS